jgi:hypothetical protein
MDLPTARLRRILRHNQRAALCVDDSQPLRVL